MKTRGIDALAALRRRPAHSGICLDFDGTLSAIVEDPATATPLPPVVDLLRELVRRFAIVEVISGRPVDFLVASLPVPGLRLSGLYGLETIIDEQRQDHPSAGAWREVVEDVASVSEGSGPSGMDVERKGFSLTLHYRTHPGAARRVNAWARRQAARSGLQARQGRMSVELHPPIGVDKGTVVEEVGKEVEAICFLGDDAGDLAAFDALDRLADRGVEAVRVAVKSTEAPLELLSRADLVVEGPAGAVKLLQTLLR